MPTGIRERRDLRHLGKLVESYAQIYLLRTGLRLGLFEALRTPHAARELAERLGLAKDLVAAWLHALHAQDLVRCEDDRYQLGDFLRRLLDGSNAKALQAMLEQTAESYGPRLFRLPELMKGAERPFFGSPEEAARTAAASRLVESRALRALASVPGAQDARRVLDIGCGYGTYLSRWLAHHRDAHGLGIELDPAIADEARRHLRELEVSRRGEILVGDFMNVELPQRTFDLILLNNNLYYFPPAEHGALFRRVFERLATGGIFALQTRVLVDNGVARLFGAASGNAVFDLVLRSHRNLYGLPDREDIHRSLREVGFAETGEVPITTGGPAIFIWARGRGRSN